MVARFCRREKEAADALVHRAGHEGFRVERELLASIEDALSRAAAATSDKDMCARHNQ
jgi:uncharacterized membrane protein YhfC